MSSDQWFREFTNRILTWHFLLVEDHFLDYYREPNDQCLACVWWHCEKIIAYNTLERVKFEPACQLGGCQDIGEWAQKVQDKLPSLTEIEALLFALEAREARYKLAEAGEEVTEVLTSASANLYPSGCELVEIARDKCHSQSPFKGTKGCDMYINELFGQACRNQPPGHILGAKLYNIETTCEIISSKDLSLVPWFQPYETEFVFAIEEGEKGRKIDDVMKRLHDGIKDVVESETYQAYLLTMSKFHRYSLGNVILITIQRRDAKQVAGYTTWKDLGRWVTKGEKGIAILAPCLPPKPKEPAPEEEEAELPEPRPIYFKVVYVFDITQTEGKELPTVEVPVLTGEVSESLWQRLLDYTASLGISLSFQERPDLDPDVKGYWNPLTGEIWVKPDEPRAQQAKTLMHEIGHHLTGLQPGIATRDHETIAESAAFVVGAHFGFDTGVRSFPYVALWAKDMEVLRRNLHTVRTVAAKMIDALEVMPRMEVATMSSNPGIAEALLTGAGVEAGKAAVQKVLGKNPENPWTPPPGAVKRDGYYELDGHFLSAVHGIALSPCEVEHDLAATLDSCVSQVQERNVERGCPAEGLGTTDCPLSYAVCRASISQPICSASEA